MKGKINRFNIIFVDIQILLTIITAVLCILYFIKKIDISLLQLSLGITLLCLSFNNYKIFKKKKMTIIYLIAGIVVLILCLFNMIGVL